MRNDRSSSAPVLLTVERSTAISSACIFRGTDKLCSVQEKDTPAIRGDICTLVDAALGEAGLEAGDCDRLGLGLGPGSFSGIRASLAFLHGMALPDGLPLQGVSSAAALAWQAMLTNPQLMETVVIGDARRNSLWLGGFRRENEILRETIPLQAVPVVKLSEYLPLNVPVLSPDWQRLEPLIATLPEGLCLQNPAVPTAEAVARLLLMAEPPLVQPPLPIYLHPPVLNHRM